MQTSGQSTDVLLTLLQVIVQLGREAHSFLICSLIGHVGTNNIKNHEDKQAGFTLCKYQIRCLVTYTTADGMIMSISTVHKRLQAGQHKCIYT